MPKEETRGYVATRTLQVKLYMTGESAMSVDRYMNDLRRDVAGMAVEKARQKRAGVTLLQINPWGTS